MITFRKLSFVAWLFPALTLACGSGGGPRIEEASTACRNAEPTTFVITDDSNYTFASALDIQMTTLKDATDLVFDWSDLTVDFFGKPVDPAADIDLVLISLFNQTPEGIEESLARDDLERGANEGAISVYPDGTFTSKNLLDFGVLGNPLPPEEIWRRFDTNDPEFEYPQDQHTFLLMAATGTTLGRGARMLSMFNVDPSSTQTELAVTNDSTTLDYTVDLERTTPFPVPLGQSSLTIDWSAMTVNALGNEYLGNQITEAVVAHFATDSLAELEENQFLSLTENADGWWTGPVTSGESIDLGVLADENGATFPGIDDSGTWLVALFCTAGCNNPAPWSISILEPCER